MADIETALCSKEDFDQILTEFAEFWEHERTLPLHHPFIIHEFGNSAFIIRQSNKIIAYLFGFLSQTAPVGYIHLLAVRRGYRRQGLAKKLYDQFTDYASSNGCKQLKAITHPANSLSIAFHKSIGMQLQGDSQIGDTPVVKDYAGRGADRVVFIKYI